MMADQAQAWRGDVDAAALFDALSARGIASVRVYFSDDLYNADGIHFRNAAGEDVDVPGDLRDDIDEVWREAATELIVDRGGELQDDGTVILDIVNRKISVSAMVRVIAETRVSDVWSVKDPTAA
jgi:hypothetical protein